MFSFTSMTRLVIYKGWTSKSTLRSDTARLSNNTFRAPGMVNGNYCHLKRYVVTLSCIVMLSVMARVKGKMALKTQFAINLA